MSRLRQLRAYEYGSSSAIQTEFEALSAISRTLRLAAKRCPRPSTRSPTTTAICKATSHCSTTPPMASSTVLASTLTPKQAGRPSSPPLTCVARVAWQLAKSVRRSSTAEWTSRSLPPSAIRSITPRSSQAEPSSATRTSRVTKIYKNGILLTPTVDYTSDHNGNSGTGTVTLTSAFATADPTITTDNFTIYKVRSTAITNFRRLDATNDTGADLAFVSFDLDDSLRSSLSPVFCTSQTTTPVTQSTTALYSRRTSTSRRAQLYHHHCRERGRTDRDRHHGECLYGHHHWPDPVQQARHH